MLALFALDALAELPPLPAQLTRGIAGREIVRLVDLAELDGDRMAVDLGEGGAAQPLYRLLLRLDLPDPEPGDELLRLREGAVVAKGSERVAEVGARFALDAMPGKQMAIDAELRGGTIDGAEARRRRRLLQRESQFYGAMDGAMKFVKGDFSLCVVPDITPRLKRA